MMKKQIYLFLALAILLINNVLAVVPRVYPAFSVTTNVSVSASAIYKDTLFMAGDFTAPAQRLVQWNGTSTSSPAGATFDAQIRSMMVFNNELFVGGNFTSPANRI